jgi:hypothetical protein
MWSESSRAKLRANPARGASRVRMVTKVIVTEATN